MPISSNSEFLLLEVMGALMAIGLKDDAFEGSMKLIEQYGTLRVQDAEIDRLSREPDQWKKAIPGYYPTEGA
jgi:hypothetical protein